MPADSELIDRLLEFLRNSDLNTTTTVIITPTDKKVFISVLEKMMMKNTEKQLKLVEAKKSTLDCIYTASSLNSGGTRLVLRSRKEVLCGFSKLCSLSSTASGRNSLECLKWPGLNEVRFKVVSILRFVCMS